MAKKDIYDFKSDVVVETHDVAKELNAVAKEYNIKPTQLDFDIQLVRTFEYDNETKGDWVELEGGLLKRLEENEHYSQSNLEIKQLYTIRIFLKDDYDDPFRDSVTHLSANDNFTTIYFIIDKGSEIHYSSTLHRDMIDIINKKKVLNHVFINIREGGFREEIKEFIDREAPVLEENYIVRVGQGVNVKKQIDDKLEFLYKKDIEEQVQSDHARVDHSKKGYIITVADGEAIIRYIKPQEGREGKDCRGKVLKVRPPKVENVPDFRISQNLRKEESESKIDYIAIKDGNVVFNDGVYDIESQVQTGALSFKHTGSINAGTDRDIEIDVKEGDAVKDAIGMGVKVTVTTLNVDGNVGEHAEIKAREVKVQGQTHQSSIIRADDVEVGIHKGKIFGDKVTINRLEAGVVEGEVVTVKDAVGGTIRAREVYITNLFSHIKVFSSKKVNIEHIKGSENLIVVDLEGYKDGVNEIEDTRKQITETSQRVEYLQRTIKEDLDEVLEIRKAFTFASKRLKKYESNGVDAPLSLLETVQHHQEFLEHYKEMKDELKVKKDKLIDLEEKFKALEGAIFDAEIRVHESWKGYNKIEFRLINPKRTLEKIIQDGNREALFQVEQIMYEDDQFEIITKKLDEI